MSLIDWIAAPFAYEVMQRALLVAVIVGACCAVMSNLLVLRGWSLLGDAVSHAVLPGIVLAFAAGIPLAVGAFLSGLACAVGSGALSASSRIKADTALGIVFAGMFGLGLVLYTRIETDQHLMHILFGNMLGVTSRDIVETAVIGLPCLAYVLARRRDLLLVAFDPAHARTIGLPVKRLDLILLMVLSLTIVVSLKAVGIILVVAMLIGPGAIASLLSVRFDHRLAIGTLAAVLSTVIGTIASFHLDAATGACIVLVQAGMFLLALLMSPRHGLLARGLRQRSVTAAQ